MNTMGRVVGRSYRKLRLCGDFLRMLLIWERLVLDGRPRELCDSPTFLNINQRILPPQHIVVNTFPDYPTACQPYVHYVVCCRNPLKTYQFSRSPRDIQIRQ